MTPSEACTAIQPLMNVALVATLAIGNVRLSLMTIGNRFWPCICGGTHVAFGGAPTVY